MNGRTAHRRFRLSLDVILFIWAGIFAYTLLEAASGLFTLHDYRPQIWLSLRWISLFYWAPWILLTPIVLLIAERLPVHPGNWWRSMPAHAGVLLGVSVVHGLMTSYAYVLVDYMSAEMASYEPWQHAGHFLFGDGLFVFDSVIYLALVALLNIKNFHQLIQQKELDAARISGQLSEAKLNALRAQVNPHFLFNTLNSISVLVRKRDTDRANTMIERLSGLFRQTLESSGAHRVPLRQELEFIGNYLDIEKIRIGDRLQVRYDLDEAALDCHVPMMITQPLVENAIKHGIAMQAGPCELKIEARLRNRHLCLRISDNGAGHDFHALADCRRGIGITNVRERLKQTYGTDLGLRLDGIRGKGVIATLELPMRDPSGHA